MSKFKFLRISKFKKLRYLSINQNANLYLVFLHGFMSDIEGDKPNNFLKYCKKRKLGFLAIEYSGHGKSSGKFTKGNISKWTEEVRISIKKIIKNKNFIVQGNKRSYGDVALNKKLLISMKNFKIEISRLNKKRKLSSYFSERLGI